MGSIAIAGWGWDTGAEVRGDNPEDWEERNKVKFSATKHMHSFNQSREFLLEAEKEQNWDVLVDGSRQDVPTGGT